jgi:hypothetical protein
MSDNGEYPDDRDDTQYTLPSYLLTIQMEDENSEGNGM